MFTAAYKGTLPPFFANSRFFPAVLSSSNKNTKQQQCRAAKSKSSLNCCNGGGHVSSAEHDQLFGPQPATSCSCKRAIKLGITTSGQNCFVHLFTACMNNILEQHALPRGKASPTDRQLLEALQFSPTACCPSACLKNPNYITTLD